MYVTITGGKITPEQLPHLDGFLAEFLPRMKQQQPGVLAILHCYRPDKGDDVTIVVWDSAEAVKAYRTGDLIKEPLAFEAAHGMSTTREGYPLSYATSVGFESVGQAALGTPTRD